MTIQITDPLGQRPAAVQQASSTPAEVAGVGGRIVRVEDENYTVSKYDAVILLSATTSTGDYTITVDTTELVDAQQVTFIMPVDPTGADRFNVVGLGNDLLFSQAGEANVRYLAEEDVAFNGSTSAPAGGDPPLPPVVTPPSGDITLAAFASDNATYVRNTIQLGYLDTGLGQVRVGLQDGGLDRFVYQFGASGGTWVIWNSVSTRWDVYTGMGNFGTTTDGTAIPGVLSFTLAVAPNEIVLNDTPITALATVNGPDPANLAAAGTLTFEFNSP